MDTHVVLPKLPVANAKDQRRIEIFKAVDRGTISSFTVSEICRVAGISRKTFYDHFDSKHDIYDWWSRYCEQFYLNEMGRTLGVEESYLYHYNLMFASGASNFRHYVQQYGMPNFGKNPTILRRCQVLTDTLENYRHVKIDDRMRFMVETLADLESLLTAQWALESPIDPDLCAQRMVDVMPRRLYEALQLE